MILFLGDIHGNFNHLKEKVIKYKFKEDDEHVNVIQVGDFGIGFTDYQNDVNTLNKLDKFLKENNTTLHVIRGNHDNPNFFNGDFIMDNLKLYPDYTMVNIEGKNILFVGGAISIDRHIRRENNLIEARVGRDVRHHWEDEVFKLDEEKLKEFGDVNIVVTHTVPHFCHPTNQKNNWPYIVKQFMGDDPNLGEDLLKERDDLTKMYDIINENNDIKVWCYGHFHNKKLETHNNTLFRLLNINEWLNYDYLAT